MYPGLVPVPFEAGIGPRNIYQIRVRPTTILGRAIKFPAKFFI